MVSVVVELKWNTLSAVKNDCCRQEPFFTHFLDSVLETFPLQNPSRRVRIPFGHANPENVSSGQTPVAFDAPSVQKCAARHVRQALMLPLLARALYVPAGHGVQSPESK